MGVSFAVSGEVEGVHFYPEKRRRQQHATGSDPNSEEGKRSYREERRRLSLGFLDILIHPSPLSLFSDRLSPGLSTLLPLLVSYDAKMEGGGNLFCFPFSFFLPVPMHPKSFRSQLIVSFGSFVGILYCSSPKF